VTSGAAASPLRRVMLAFDGRTLPSDMAERLARAPAAGITLFRHHNVSTPDQVLALTESIQRAAGATEAAPLLIGADQETGQLIALCEATTPFAGNMALGAADDLALTEQVGRAIGLEARAMGVNVVYAPCLDLATNPLNPAAGTRAFGDDPAAVGRHGIVFLAGLQSAGVAGTVKHAPGIGHGTEDTHHVLAVVDSPRDVLDARELVPFVATFKAGPDAAPRLVMTGHSAFPGLSGRADLAATLARTIVTDLLRTEFGFDGVIISDALDMGAIMGGPDQAPDVEAAILAGVDILLTGIGPRNRARVEAALEASAAAGAFDHGEMAVGDRRIGALRQWLGGRGPRPGLEVVGCPDHRALAVALARRSVTMVRDPAGLLPVRAEGLGVLAVMPRPMDLTPADTSGIVEPGLALALRRAFPDVDEVVTEQRPDAATIAAVRDRAAAAGLAVVGTIDGHRHPEQLELLHAVAATGIPTIGVALRGPWDVAHYPSSVTAMATYSINPPSLEALVSVLEGSIAAVGRLPVALPA
jgi:beta-N-acetylhexosaminidase